jgi:mono/diheme cytochrome c family protein
VRRWALPLLALVAACDSLPGKPTEADRPLRPAQVVDFDTLYGANCSGCHGADGKLGAARPLNDPVYLAIAGADRLRQVTAAGVPDSLMPGFAGSAGGMLTDEQIDLIVRGMVSRWGGGGPPDVAALPAYATRGPGDAQRGGAAYAAYCAGCHGADGKGGEKGGPIVDGSYLALVSDQALRTAVVCGRPDLGMPDWRGEPGARPMSDQEITDVVAWLIAQRPPFPGQPYQ